MQQKRFSTKHFVQRHLPHFKKIVLLGLFYAALAFLYSAIGFLHPEASHFHEYTGTKFAIEVLGHFSFGFIASIPLWDLEISLLTGAAAVLIDTDHVLSALCINISGRPDHSFLFVLVSAVILFYFVERSNFPKISLIKFMFFAPIVVFSHISYDIFAVPLGSSSSFQLLIPFSFELVTIPYDYWILFEAVALILSFVGYFLANRFGEEKKQVAKIEIEKERIQE